MRILFTRHGESEANVRQIISNRDLPHGLTKKGIAQAAALADRMAEAEVRAIYCSSILRAVETATIVAERLGLPFIITPALMEFDCGRMEGRHAGQAWAAHEAVVRAWDDDRDYERRIEPDGESFNDMKARFLPFVQQVVHEYEESAGDILLISHGGMLHQMLPLVLVNVDREFTKKHGLGNCEVVVSHVQGERLIGMAWAGMQLQRMGPASEDAA